MRLTFVESLMYLLGLGYVANPNTKEIHRLDRKHRNCNLDLIVKKKYITGRKAYRLLTKHHYDEGWDGCRYCFNEMNTG
jgi:hypothetical protein